MPRSSTRAFLASALPVVGVPLAAAGMAAAFRGAERAHWRRLALTHGTLGLAALAVGRPATSGRLTGRDVRVALSVGAGLVAAGTLADAASRRVAPRLGRDAETLSGLATAIGPARMCACLALVIAPGEELFWRGVVQDRLAERYGPHRAALLVSAVYGLAHVPTGNAAVTGAATAMGTTLAFQRANGASLERLALTHACWVVPTLLTQRLRASRATETPRDPSEPQKAGRGQREWGKTHDGKHGENEMTAPPHGRRVTRFGRFAQQVNNAAHVALYERTGGRLGKRMLGHQVGILTTSQRGNGEPYAVPVFTFRDGDDVLIVASYRGSAEHPRWFRNLVADPDATLRVGDRSWPVRARVLAGDERAAAWRWLVRSFQGYATYQRRTERELPVIRLTPRPEAA
ncbi:nitroreductase/quinone reductase family protein [Streptomyces sp. DSM 44915]|uniref:Nitroreductase/quinone reductase family protein n=1 Tax=Streptomyces chisholmiae TaxID=3075540 RepID=A0ABU2JVF8_9ACTN|nr:nitroreductase/quinone reductase family protein [Streptomyces sp. DSM 44915]MDT0268746.1 nitroreductase/quinone reductase family protein [Streptomyces sp. DSM 44915]